MLKQFSLKHFDVFKKHRCEVSPRFVDVDILSPLCRKHVDEQKIYFVLRRKYVDGEILSIKKIL